MTRRSIPSSFHANLFALVPARCPSSTCGVAMVVIEAALGDVPFLPALGDTPCSDPFEPISYALDEEFAFLPHDANLAQHLGNSG